MTVRGLGNLSTDIDYPGHTMFGGNAQFVVRPASYWLPLPEGVSPLNAAAAMWAYATACRILADRLQVRSADSVLIVGASGGMGTATVDLARLAGLRVVATMRTEAKLTAGEGSSAPVPIRPSDFVRLELNVRGTRASTLNDQRVVLELLAQDRIRPAIHSTMPMSQGREAHAMLERGDITGRLLLDPWA